MGLGGGDLLDLEEEVGFRVLLVEEVEKKQGESFSLLSRALLFSLSVFFLLFQRVNSRPFQAVLASIRTATGDDTLNAASKGRRNASTSVQQRSTEPRLVETNQRRREACVESKKKKKRAARGRGLLSNSPRSENASAFSRPLLLFPFLFFRANASVGSDDAIDLKQKRK